MKRFFSLNLRGRDFVWPMLGMWLLVLVVSGCTVAHFVAAAESTMTIVDGTFALRLLLGVAIQIALWSGVALTLLPIVQRSLVATEFEGEAVECTYDRRRYLGLVLGGVALSVVTCGLYLPWFIVRLMKFFAEGVSHRFNLVSFRGKAMRLFAITILTAILPAVVVELVLVSVGYDAAAQPLDMMSFAPLLGLAVVLVELFFVSLFVILLCRWMVDMTYGDKVISTRLSPLSAACFVMWQLVLTMITAGLYAPMAELRTMRYVAERCVVVGPDGEKSMGLRLRSWRDWAWVWGQVLIFVLTLGFYLPWYYAKVMNRFGSRLYVEE